MDLEAESIIRIDTGMSSDIAKACNKLLDVQKQISNAEEQVKKLKEAETLLSEQTIPNLMQQAGIRELKLEDGSAVSIKPSYYASIKTEHTQAAFQWLRENGFSDLIKNKVTLSFGSNEDEEALNVLNQFQQKGYNVEQAQKVESMTLKTFVKEQIQEGKSVPVDLFGVYVANKTKITKKE
jgi:hypothetical protein